MLNPAVLESSKSTDSSQDFWTRLLSDEQLRGYDDLEKLVIGCEIIAAWDTTERLAA